MDEFLRYACEMQAGMTTFNDMGAHWVKVREAVKVRTIGVNDVGKAEVCRKFDQLNRHVALQLSALTGQRVTSVVPANHPDAVSRAKQLAGSGELFGSLRITGAAGLVVLNANLGTERIGCSMSTFAPRTGRPSSKIGWLTRQLGGASGSIRVTSHHAGSRTESTSALLTAVLEDPTTVLPPNGKGIREFTVALEASMGSKRAGSEGGFVTSMVKLANTFHVEVVEKLRDGRDMQLDDWASGAIANQIGAKVCAVSEGAAEVKRGGEGIRVQSDRASAALKPRMARHRHPLTSAHSRRQGTIQEPSSPSAR